MSGLTWKVALLPQLSIRLKRCDLLGDSGDNSPADRLVFTITLNTSMVDTCKLYHGSHYGVQLYMVSLIQY